MSRRAIQRPRRVRIAERQRKIRLGYRVGASGGCEGLADVQLKRGFTMIADALLEAICRTSIPGRHHRVFAALIRLTYGYGKRSDRIAASQISALTGIDRRSVTRILRDLEAAGMIARGPLERGRSRRIAIVKDFDRWVPTATSEVVDDPGCSDSPGGVADPGCGDAPTGVADPGGGSPEAPLVGSSAPPTIEKERLSRESGARAPTPPLSESLRVVKPKTLCPDRLDPEDRAEVIAWRDKEHRGKFPMRDLSSQWARFRRWHRGERTLCADWAGRFENWLTNDFYRPSPEERAQPEVYRSSDEPPEELDAAEWARVTRECDAIREAAGMRRREVGRPPAVLRSGRDRVIAI